VITATPRTFWERVKDHRAELAVLRGDWTDYWNFGCISAAPKPPSPDRCAATLSGRCDFRAHPAIIITERRDRHASVAATAMRQARI
jgi:hypothetical protein